MRSLRWSYNVLRSNFLVPWQATQQIVSLYLLDPIRWFANRRGSPWSSTGMRIHRITKRWLNFGRWPRINAALHFDASRLASLQDSFVSARVLPMLSFRIYRFSIQRTRIVEAFDRSRRICRIFHRWVCRRCYGKVAIYFDRRSSWFGLQVQYLLTAMTDLVDRFKSHLLARF